MPSDFLEKSLEDIIFDNKDVIHSKGLPKFKNSTFRQFELPSGKKIDLITFSLFRGSVSVDIYELKKEQIDTATVCQVYNYAREFIGLISEFFPVIQMKLVVVGKSYVPISILEGVNMPVEIYTYDYTMDGVLFNKQSSDPKEFLPNNNFVNALVTFGHGKLTFPNGQPKVINITSQYFDWLKTHPDFDHEIEVYKREYLTASKPILLPSSTTEYNYDERIKYVNEYRDFDDATYETDE